MINPAKPTTIVFTIL